MLVFWNWKGQESHAKTQDNLLADSVMLFYGIGRTKRVMPRLGDGSTFLLLTTGNPSAASGPARASVRAPEGEG